MTLARKIRFVSELTQRVREIIPEKSDRFAGLSPKARAVCENYVKAASPERRYIDMINDSCPLPNLPREPVKIDSTDDLLAVVQDAYRAELESGRKQMELRQVYEKLRQGIAK